MFACRPNHPFNHRPLCPLMRGLVTSLAIVAAVDKDDTAQIPSLKGSEKTARLPRPRPGAAEAPDASGCAEPVETGGALPRTQREPGEGTFVHFPR